MMQCNIKFISFDWIIKNARNEIVTGAFNDKTD